MIWNCTFDGQTPSEVRYWATGTHPVDSDISECVYLQWKSTRSRMCWDKQSWAADGPWLKQLILYYTQEPSDSLTLEWKSTCLQTVSRGTRDISLILHGHQNAPRSHGSILYSNFIQKRKSGHHLLILMPFQTCMTFFCGAQKGKTLRKATFF